MDYNTIIVYANIIKYGRDKGVPIIFYNPILVIRYENSIIIIKFRNPVILRNYNNITKYISYPVFVF